eukprot:4172131-Amphidinium_carterae.1
MATILAPSWKSVFSGLFMCDQSLVFKEVAPVSIRSEVKYVEPLSCEVKVVDVAVTTNDVY